MQQRNPPYKTFQRNANMRVKTGKFLLTSTKSEKEKTRQRGDIDVTLPSLEELMF